MRVRLREIAFRMCVLHQYDTLTIILIKETWKRSTLAFNPRLSQSEADAEVHCPLRLLKRHTLCRHLQPSGLLASEASLSSASSLGLDGSGPVLQH